MIVQNTFYSSKFIAAILVISIAIIGQQTVFGQGDTITDTKFSSLEIDTYSTKPCEPHIICNTSMPFLSLYNLKQASPSEQLECAQIYSLKHTDQKYIITGQNLEKPDHYFNWKNWNIIKIKGDGGVDVTGAPNTVLVEGANSTLFNVNPGSLLRLSIAIPAEGFITFDWSNIGGSNIFPQVFCNEKAVRVRNSNITTPLLRAGDTLTICLKATENIANVIKLTNFEFLTNAFSIVKRNWISLIDDQKKCEFSQMIALYRPVLSDIMLPKNLDGVEAPFIKTGASYTPLSTGYPVIDLDKNSFTKNDRISVGELEEMEVSWEDEIVKEQFTTTIVRRWLIKDQISGNEMRNSQKIKFRNPEYVIDVQTVPAIQPNPLKSIDQQPNKPHTITFSSSKEKNKITRLPKSQLVTSSIHMHLLNLYTEVI